MELVERKKVLDIEVSRLRHKLVREDPYGAMKEGFHEKKQELKELESMSYKMYTTISVHDSLIAKFTVMASGTKHKGRYKSAATRHRWLLNSRFFKNGTKKR
jgi:hypothetical protein